MWEAIRENRRRSRLLIGLMGAILVGFGALIGLTLFGQGGGLAGALIALAVWALLLAVTFWGGERVVLFSAGAREVRKVDAPRLWNVVEEMAIASGLGKPPRVFVIDEYLQNAFATGRTPETACVVVTAGLIRRLNRDELQGVIAHEMGHIKNHDIRFMTIASVMLGSITLLSDLFRRHLWFGGGRRGRFKGGGQAQIILVVITLAAAILAPLFAQILYFACSRKREYLADASAARFTRYPEGLAAALEKISRKVGITKGGVLRSLAPMYIVNPLQAALASPGLFSTHPPTAKRVAILRQMSGNAGWVDYERAFRKVMGKTEHCLERDVLASEGSIRARIPDAEPEAAEETLGLGREVGELLDRLVNFLLIPCLCGVRIKVPPDFRKESIRCPRCGREHAIPGAEAESQEGSGAATGNLQYRRRGEGWQSFRCRCGKVHQLSPGFHLPSMVCRSCRTKITILER